MHIIEDRHNKDFINCLDFMPCEINDFIGEIQDDTLLYTPGYIKLYEEFISFNFYNISFMNRYNIAKKIIQYQNKNVQKHKDIYIPNTISDKDELKMYLEEQFNSYNKKLLVKYTKNKTISFEFLKLIYRANNILAPIQYTNWIYLNIDCCNIGNNDIIYFEPCDPFKSSTLESLVNKPVNVYIPKGYKIFLYIINYNELTEVLDNIYYYKNNIDSINNKIFVPTIHNPNIFNMGNIILKDGVVAHITHSQFNIVSQIYTIHYDLLEGVNFSIGDIISINNLTGLIVQTNRKYLPKDILNILEKRNSYPKATVIQNYTPKGFYVKNDKVYSGISASPNRPYFFNIYSPLIVDYSYSNSFDILGMPNKKRNISIINNKTYITKYKIIQSYFTHSYNLSVYIRSRSRPKINNTVLIENHQFPLSSKSSTRFIKLTNILPFYKYIESFHILYNKLLDTQTGHLFKDKLKKINCNICYISKTSEEKKKSIRYIGDCAKVAFYTDNLGRIKKIYLLSMGNGYHHKTRRTISLSNFDIQVRLHVEIRRGHIVKIISITNPGLGYGLKTIPFYNKFIGINLHNNILDYNTVHLCHYTRRSLTHNKDKGVYFNITKSEKYISKINIHKNGISQDIMSLLVAKLESQSLNNITPRVIFIKISDGAESTPIIFELKSIIEDNQRSNVLIQINQQKNLIFNENDEYKIVINIPRQYICFDKYINTENHMVPYNYRPFSMFTRILSKYILSDYTPQYYTKRIIKIKILTEQIPLDNDFYKIYIYNSNKVDVFVGYINKVIPLGINKYILLVNIDTTITKSTEIDALYNLLNKDNVKIIFNYRNGLGMGSIIERCVFKDKNNIKFFDSGDFDLCYTEYLKNKTIIDYSDYESYKLVNNQDILFTKRTKLEESNIKVINSNIMPNIHLKEWDNFHKNKTLLNKDYTDLQHIKSGSFFKYSEPPIKIPDRKDSKNAYDTKCINTILTASVLFDIETNEYKSFVICKRGNISQSDINMYRETLVILGANDSCDEELGHIEYIIPVESYDTFEISTRFKIMEEKPMTLYEFPTILIIFNNRLLINTDGRYNYIKILYPIAHIKETHKSVNEYSIIEVQLNNTLHKNLYKSGELICIDYGNKRQLVPSDFSETPYNINDNSGVTKSTTLFRQIIRTTIIDNGSDVITLNVYVHKLPFLIPYTKVLLMNNFTSQSENNISSRPFIYNDEWYTRVPFKNKFTDYNSSFEEMNEYNDRVYSYKFPRQSISSSILINSAKGVSIPFMNINKNENNEFEYLHSDITKMTSVLNGIYTNYNNIIGDFQSKSFSNPWESCYDESYDWVIIKGLYFGYSGNIQSIYNNRDHVPNIRKYIFNTMEVLPDNIYKLHLSTNIENPKIYSDDIEYKEFSGKDGYLINNLSNKPYNLSNEDKISLSIKNFNYIEDSSGGCFSLISNNTYKETQFIGGHIYKNIVKRNGISELDIQLKTVNGDIYNSVENNAFVFEITEKIERVQ